jgi:hypothetical protein
VDASQASIPAFTFKMELLQDISDKIQNMRESLVSDGARAVDDHNDVQFI